MEVDRGVTGGNGTVKGDLIASADVDRGASVDGSREIN